MRFASHRDVARAIERGVRKAAVPVAYSAGFSPHPRISYSGGAPTGSASEAEYLEIAVTRRCEPADVGRRLDEALPDGIDVVEVTEADGRSAGLMLEASDWEVLWPGVVPAAAACAVTAFLAQPSVEVERLTSKGTRRLDARAAVVSLTVVPGPGRCGGTDLPAGCAILRMIVRHMTPAVRPDDVLAALTQLSALAPGLPPLATRLWQGPLSELDAVQAGKIVDIEGAEPARLTRLPEPATLVTAAGQAGDPAGAGPQRRQHIPGDLGPSDGPEPGPAERGPGRMTDKAAFPRAESARPAPAGRGRANEQLPRGTLGQLAAQRAREPYGRDCPDARNGVTEPTARPQ